MDVRVQDTISRRHAEHSTRPEVKGCVLLAAQYVLMLAAASNLLRYNVKVMNHIINRNGARWHYNTLRLKFGYKFKLDRKYIIAISNEILHTIC